jgi:hypothetical protein
MAIMMRTLLVTLSIAAAQAPADFSGTWTLVPPQIATTAAVPGTPAAAAAPGDMGSGWGSPLTISQDAKQLRIEYAFFSRYDAMPPLVFVFPLDGSEGRNTIWMGRGEQVESSKAQWMGQTLVITTTMRVDDRAAGKPFTTRLTRRLTLESPTTMIVEVTRDGVLGGAATTTRSIYKKG